MDATGIWQEVLGRLQASLGPQPVPASSLLLFGVLIAGLVVGLGPCWRGVRTIVTVVHELGHAVVGMAFGRRFTGLVINPDMSGHTITVGKPRGVGIVASTAAGYPMPAIVGTLVVWSAMSGRAGLTLLIALFALLLALIRARSLYTLLTLAGMLAAVGYLWWLGDPAVSAAVVCAAGVVLVLGGWRQLAAVVRRGDARQDPAALARLTRLPVTLWNLGFLLVNTALTGWLATLLAPPLTAATQALLT